MKRFASRPTLEAAVLAALLLSSLLGLALMDFLVAPPKVLFGRALSSVAPSLFPSIVLALLAALSTLLLFLLRRRGGGRIEQGQAPGDWRRGAAFFGILVLYALTMRPFGFLASTAVACALLSWLMGNRSWAGIAVLSLASPSLLYLGATRLLAVSLPELDAIELFHARLLGWVAG